MAVQRDEAWLRGASLEEIRAAHLVGKMADLLRQPDAVEQVNAADSAR